MIRRVLLSVVLGIGLGFVADAAETVSNVTYDASIGDFGKGDLYLPDALSADTPMVLVIHGGSWCAESRASMRFVSEFFQQDLHMAVYNIEYRLAAPGRRWPACGDDCIKAAKFLLSDAFRRRYGLGYRKIFLCGGSAGGHLALWTLVNMPKDAIAGCISVSSVGDPAVDFAVTPVHYLYLFDSNWEANLPLMDPCRRISSGMAPLLCTHATNDRVVPIASHRAFANAYEAAGNASRFFEYDSRKVLPDVDPGELNHFCMRSGGRFVYEIEDEISRFVGEVLANERWKGRPVNVVSVERDASGVATRAEIDFGEGNGLTNGLYMVWGLDDRGPTTNGWDHVERLEDVTDETHSRTVGIPSGARCLRFVLSTPTCPGDSALQYVTGDGYHAIDAGMQLAAGDVVSVRFRTTEGESSSVLGSRANVNAGNILLALDYATVVLDYCGSGETGDYANYRLAQTGARGWYAGKWLDAVLAPEFRSLTEVETGLGWTNAVPCEHRFETPTNILLFGASGNPSAPKRFHGQIASFSVVRDGHTLADWTPYRYGGVCGFFDRVGGRFRGAAGLTGVAVESDAGLMTSSDLIVTGAAMKDLLGAIDVPLMTIETVGGELPTCEPADSPEGAIGHSIRNATKVPGRLTVSERGTVVYDSGEYDKDAETGMTVKIRGNTSARGSGKKPYKVKLMKKADLLRRGDDSKYKDKNWVLLTTANTLNDPVGFKVNELVGLSWTPSCQYVNLMMNGEYLGLYLLVESVNRNEKCRINVSERGFVVEIDAYWWNEDGHYFKTPRCPVGMGYTFKYPDADDLTQEQVLSISNAIVGVEESIWNDTYPSRIDTGSWASWVLGHDILGTADPAGSNQYLAKYDDGADTLVSRQTLWDFGACLSSGHRDSWAYVHALGQGYFDRLQASVNRAFHTAYFLRWEQVRVRLESEIATLLNDMRESGFARAFDLSRKLETGGNFKPFDSLAADIRDWFSRRVVWLDDHMDLMAPDPTLARMIRGMQEDPVWTARLRDATFVSRFGADLISAALVPSGKTDGSGRKLFNYDEYVAGTDPLRLDSLLRAVISVEAGEVRVRPDPELKNRTYTIWACEEIGGAWHTTVTGKDRFFKLTAGLEGTGK